MPSPSRPTPLSDDHITAIRAELADGRQPAVWFTPAAVGVDAGRSAKVVAFTDPPEGDFIQVKPTGSRDVLSFSPNELTMDKPPRRKPEPPAPRQPEPAEEPAKAEAPAEEFDELLVVRERPTRKPANRPTPAADEPRRPSGGRGRQPAPVTVTLSSTAEGEWTVDVITGKKRTVRPTAIAPSKVAQAARALGDEVAEAIEGVLNAAREQQRARVVQLQAELAAAQQALSELND